MANVANGKRRVSFLQRFTNSIRSSFSKNPFAKRTQNNHIIPKTNGSSQPSPSSKSEHNLLPKIRDYSDTKIEANPSNAYVVPNKPLQNTRNDYAEAKVASDNEATDAYSAQSLRNVAKRYYAAVSHFTDRRGNAANKSNIADKFSQISRKGEELETNNSQIANNNTYSPQSLRSATRRYYETVDPHSVYLRENTANRIKATSKRYPKPNIHSLDKDTKTITDTHKYKTLFYSPFEQSIPQTGRKKLGGNQLSIVGGAPIYRQITGGIKKESQPKALKPAELHNVIKIAQKLREDGYSQNQLKSRSKKVSFQNETTEASKITYPSESIVYPLKLDLLRSNQVGYSKYRTNPKKSIRQIQEDVKKEIEIAQNYLNEYARLSTLRGQKIQDLQTAQVRMRCNQIKISQVSRLLPSLSEKIETGKLVDNQLNSEQLQEIQLLAKIVELNRQMRAKLKNAYSVTRAVSDLVDEMDHETATTLTHVISWATKRAQEIESLVGLAREQCDAVITVTHSVLALSKPLNVRTIRKRSVLRMPKIAIHSSPQGNKI